jgi:hypothetical protein
MTGESKHSLKSFVLELLVYGALVTVYFFAVLHFLGDWLAHVYGNNKKLYAVAALGLIIIQGVVLEMITTGLLRFFYRQTD